MMMMMMYTVQNTLLKKKVTQFYSLCQHSTERKNVHVFRCQSVCLFDLFAQ